MKLFGIELKFNGFDIFHRGNFNPDTKQDLIGYTPSREDKTNSKTLNIGWYRIAQNAGNRAFAHFIIRETDSGSHQTVSFLAGVHYGGGATINVLGNSAYSGNGSFRYIRLLKKGTYDPVYLEVYVDRDSVSGVQAFMYNNYQSNGWEIVDLSAGELPEGYTEVIIDLDQARGFNTTDKVNADNGFAWGGQSLDARYETKNANIQGHIVDTVIHISQTEKDTWNAKQDAIAGGASTVTSANLTASRALVSNSSGKVAVSAVTATELGYVDGVTSNIQTQLNSKAPLASPALTGTPTAPTATAGTNTTQIATTAFVQTAMGSAGLGDMLKSVYDTNNDGKVDNAKNADAIYFQDTRSVVDIPSGLEGNKLTGMFKYRSSVGNPPVNVGSGDFVYILNVIGWSSIEGSGGWPIQVAFGTEGMAYRQATSASTWGSWRKISNAITTSPAAPSPPSPGDFWYKEL